MKPSLPQNTTPPLFSDPPSVEKEPSVGADSVRFGTSLPAPADEAPVSATELNKLLDLGIELGYHLQLSGAETYRVEDSVQRLFRAYHVECQAFSVPNTLILSITTPAGQTRTRLRRIEYHGNNIDAMERYNALCRKICAEKPTLEEACAMMKREKDRVRPYSLPVRLFAYLFASAAFAVFFGANLRETVAAGITGLACGLTLEFTSWLYVNEFFQIILGGFVITMFTQTFAALSLIERADTASVGAIMLLVPGLVFTNCMRDIIYGNTLSGINRLVQVIISAAAIALGTSSAIVLFRLLWGKATLNVTNIPDSLAIQCLFSFIACIGYSILYNAKGIGICFCAAGGALNWAVFTLCTTLGMGDFLAGFCAAGSIALYSELMARLRKYPATSYLIVSLLPLVPGASIYYAIEHLLNGNSELFTARVVYTAGMAGSLAVGVLLVSSLFRMASTLKRRVREKRLG